jgi:hypothetical protein
MSAINDSLWAKHATMKHVASHLPPTFARFATSLMTESREIITIATCAEFVA